LHQPGPAYFAIVVGSLLLIFNGWDTIYQALQPGADTSDIIAGSIKSYLGPLIFAALFCVHKYMRGATARMVTFPEVREYLDGIANNSNELESLPNVSNEQNLKPPSDDARWKTFLKAIM
jgi:amino acid permease